MLTSFCSVNSPAFQGFPHVSLLKRMVNVSFLTQEQAKAASELSKSLEAVRGRLQAQLRSKEAENNRLSTRIRVCLQGCSACGLSWGKQHSQLLCCCVWWLEYWLQLSVSLAHSTLLK